MVTATTKGLTLDFEMGERVQKLAEARQRSVDWIMREAIEEYVSREERREALRKETLDAWNSYEATGMHLTEQEVDEWLSKVEAGEDAVAPECHV